jgi:hypothetical protein
VDQREDRDSVQDDAEPGPFEDEAKVGELRDRLNKIPRVEIPADAIARRPSFLLAVLTDDAALKAFLGVPNWYIAEVKAT